ncbi:hypothetical protein J2X97_003775 [Epilithonimonas hungarica]|uniref:hypothetical protein n=1 Tax=Epilithonimonas hungarica TaxID=454006 RepID=UPI0027873D4B|nr:hypothetical protein [Epilithonimonas hungarica]MDP9958101.1 hypothetical protein [Epilithonimonas hungarica]
MKKHFTGFLAKVEMLKSEKATSDKNGLMPIILIGVAGEIPSRTVISGTYASNMNLEVGNVYLFQGEELEEDPMFGRQFSFRTISKELSAIETLQASNYVGKLRIIDVDSSDFTEEIAEGHLELSKVL